MRKNILHTVFENMKQVYCMLHMPHVVCVTPVKDRLFLIDEEFFKNPLFSDSDKVLWGLVTFINANEKWSGM